MNKRILDFDFQLSRLFGEFIYDYDNIESSNGLYDIIFLHREGIQDNFNAFSNHHLTSNVWPYTNSTIVCDVTTESGNIDTYLDCLTEISSKEPFDVYLIVDCDISDYIEKNTPNFNCLSGYDLGIYAFTNQHSDSKTYVGGSVQKNTNSFLTNNGSMRTNRILILLELVKRGINYSPPNITSFLFYQSNKKFNQEEYEQFLEGMYHHSYPKYVFTKEDFIAELNLEFSNLINSYKQEREAEFGAYVARNLPLRIPGIFDRNLQHTMTGLERMIELKNPEAEIISVA